MKNRGLLTHYFIQYLIHATLLSLNNVKKKYFIIQISNYNLKQEIIHKLVKVVSLLSIIDKNTFFFVKMVLL